MQERINKKIVSLESAVQLRVQFRKKHFKTVVTNGCFDILHKGHLSYLHEAKRHGDKLIVGINSDLSVKKLKGNGRPIYSQEDRCFCLACLEFVDLVVLFNDVRCINFLSTIKPDIYIKGQDYSLDTIDTGERRALEKIGSKIEFIPLLKGYSTSGIINKIKNL